MQVLYPTGNHFQPETEHGKMKHPHVPKAEMGVQHFINSGSNRAPSMQVTQPGVYAHCVRRTRKLHKGEPLSTFCAGESGCVSCFRLA